jgi:SAM-dependent methyltransferase
MNLPAARQCAGQSYSANFEQYKAHMNKVARYDLAMFGWDKQASILDLGCGFGDRIRLLRGQGFESVFGVEVDPYCVAKTNDKNISVGSITATNVKANSMDVVLVENVFHHISEYSDALAEIHRILKPKGSLCFIEPRNSWFRRALDFVTFRTPVPALLGGVWKLRKAVMGEEMETGLYPLWLDSHDQFFGLLDRTFRIVWLKKNPWFYFCKAEKLSQSKARAA